jgi:hypothetical protein
VHIDPLGIKAATYRRLAMEQWGPLRQLTEVRLAIITGVCAVLILLAAAPSLIWTADPTALGAGSLLFIHTVMELRPFRDRWNAWRTIGSIRLEVPTIDLVPGQHTPFVVHLVPRRVGQLQSIALHFAYRESRSQPSATVWEVDAVISTTALAVRQGCDVAIDVVLPPGVPPSRYDDQWMRAWTVTAVVTLTDGRYWRREYPVMVHSGLMPGATSGGTSAVGTVEV